MLKGATLDVLGHDNPTSDGAVAEVVEYFMNAPGLREHHGWAARELVPGLVEVRLSHWNGDEEADAIWHVVPTSGSIRYRNRQAKYMSWLPDG